MIAKIIELIINYSDWLLLYAVAGMITLLILIQSWKRVHESYADIENSMTQIFLLSMLAWPYVMIVWVLSWPVFSWKFWLRPIAFKPIRLPVSWWVK